MPQSGGAFKVLQDNSSGNRYKKITKVLLLKRRVLNLVAVHTDGTVVFCAVLQKALETLWHSTSAIYG
jgi:hypothetical protein